MIDLRFAWRSFTELSREELYAALRLRAEVFIVEQQSIYLDLDDRDQACWHLLAWEGAQLAGYLRLVPPGVRFPVPSLGRVVTALAVRRKGVGRRLFAEGMRECANRYPHLPIRISAQCYLEKFYRSFGFLPIGEPYEEDGIAHLDMLRDQAAAAE